MRLRLIVCFFAFLIALYLLIIRVLNFIGLFYEHSGIALTQSEVVLAHKITSPGDRVPLIPKIIHQVYHDWDKTGMPGDWEKLRQSCREKNKDWQYILWDERSSREFLSSNFPWFLKTYDGYRHPVQRIDSIRYFLMRHFGGIYLDLDNGCLQSLEPLLYYPTWTTDGGRGALSNNILGATPNHPFWRLLTNSLQAYDYNYIFPYITVSLASGQWFETAIWEVYHSMLPTLDQQRPESRLYRIMMDDRPGSAPSVFFSQERGGTWVKWDNQMFLWIGDHLILLGCILAVFSGLIGFVYMRSCHVRYMHLKAYDKTVENMDEEEGENEN